MFAKLLFVYLFIYLFVYLLIYFCIQCAFSSRNSFLIALNRALNKKTFTMFTCLEHLDIHLLIDTLFIPFTLRFDV